MTRPGAIDTHSQWKGSHCFDREQTIFHIKRSWAFGVSSDISELSINSSVTPLCNLCQFFFFFNAHMLHVSLCVCICICVGRDSYVCLSCFLGAMFYSLNLKLFWFRLEVLRDFNYSFTVIG